MLFISHNLCAGIDGQPEIGRGDLVGIDMNSAKWCVHLDILFLTVRILIDVDSAARNSCNQSCSGQNTDRFPIHQIHPHTA